jgi:hypothetical protein
MHLAGAVHFAGFLSVVATMWGIRDEDAPVVAESAAALNYADMTLRRNI